MSSSAETRPLFSTQSEQIAVIKKPGFSLRFVICPSGHTALARVEGPGQFKLCKAHRKLKLHPLGRRIAGRIRSTFFQRKLRNTPVAAWNRRGIPQGNGGAKSGARRSGGKPDLQTRTSDRFGDRIVGARILFSAPRAIVCHHCFCVGAIRITFAVAESVARCFGVTAQTPPWSAWHPDRYCRGASSLPGFPAKHRGAP
jgi:hypothetical protein